MMSERSERISQHGATVPHDGSEERGAGMSLREGSQRERGVGPRRKREAFPLGPATTAVGPEERRPDRREERA